MAKTVTTLTVLLFLFSFSDARIPSDFPLNDVIHGDLRTSKLEIDDFNPVLLLPSEKPQHSDAAAALVVESEDSEPETADPNTVSADAQSIDSVEDLPESVTETVNSIPLTRPMTIVTFRPVNRRFRLKRSYPFRFSHRGCRHNRRFDPTSHRFGEGREREVSYGNDMILSSSANDKNEFDPLMFHGRVRQIPGRLIRSHHHHHHHHHHHNLNQNLKRWFNHDQDEEIEKGDKEEHGEREEGGLVKRIRKFLNHF